MAPASRRGIVAALLSAPVAGAVPALAATSQPDPDARLRGLVADLARADAECDRACDATDAAGDRFLALGGRGPVSEALFCRPGDLAFYIHSTAIDEKTDRPYVSDAAIEHLRHSPRERGYPRQPWPEAQARADEIVAAWDAWKAEVARREETSGLTAASAAWQAAMTAYGAAWRAVTREPARTLDGIRLKAWVLSRLHEHDVSALTAEIERAETFADHALPLSIARDLLNLGDAS